MTILQENIDAVIDQLTYIRDVVCPSTDIDPVQMKQNIEWFRIKLQEEIMYTASIDNEDPDIAMFIKGMQHASELFNDIFGESK